MKTAGWSIVPHGRLISLLHRRALPALAENLQMEISRTGVGVDVLCNTLPSQHNIRIILAQMDALLEHLVDARMFAPDQARIDKYVDRLDLIARCRDTYTLTTLYIYGRFARPTVAELEKMTPRLVEVRNSMVEVACYSPRHGALVDPTRPIHAHKALVALLVRDAFGAADGPVQRLQAPTELPVAATAFLGSLEAQMVAMPRRTSTEDDYASACARAGNRARYIVGEYILVHGSVTPTATESVEDDDDDETKETEEKGYSVKSLGAHLSTVDTSVTTINVTVKAFSMRRADFDELCKQFFGGCLNPVVFTESDRSKRIEVCDGCVRLAGHNPVLDDDKASCRYLHFSDVSPASIVGALLFIMEHCLEVMNSIEIDLL